MKRLLRWMKSRFLWGLATGVVLALCGFTAADYSSSDSFCASCHVHPQAHESWKRSSHRDNPSGVTVHCVDCHLPPRGIGFYLEKARLGARDLWGTLFKDALKIDWEAKSRLDRAKDYVFKESCTHCHANLFPLTLSKKGDEAHLHYSRHEEELRCINCHLHVGHYKEGVGAEEAFGRLADQGGTIFTEATRVDSFVDFVERIPGSTVSFEMKALPGGTFAMGSPEDEPLRRPDEGPVRSMEISPFWMGKVEVTWREYEVFYAQTAAEGRTDTRVDPPEGTDAITGATPPYGTPDQGWGRGDRPAITMTHHAAMTYCRWLSKITGKRYRLPTEAEWEYACRGGTSGPYFFEGDPDDFSEDGFWNSLLGADLEGIDPYVVFRPNSGGMTHPPSRTKPNPFGLVNMCGNVREFCLDLYRPDAYSRGPEGPEQGDEHVVRGGSFKSGAGEVRCAARDHTCTAQWLLTDPQVPKSKWWYSDCIDVGFRLVCEYEEER